MSQYAIRGVLSCDARQIWSLVVDWIEQALAVDGLTKSETILREIENQNMQLWLVFEADKPVAVFVTEIIVFDLHKVLHTAVLGGKGMDQWLEYVEQKIVDYAKQHDCKRVQLQGRRGWVKALNQFGWSEKTVKVTKEI